MLNKFSIDKFYSSMHQFSKNEKLLQWVLQVAELCQPKDIYWCDGSNGEYDMLCETLVENKTFIKLSEIKRPNCYLARSHESDVARVEDRTFICSKTKEEAGPTNNWANPEEMKIKLMEIFQGSMQGRTMYVVPFCMGPIGSELSKIGIEITDSAYVAVNMKIMARMGKSAIEMLGAEGEFIPCLHSVGAPLKAGEVDVPWPCHATQKYIVHFPEDLSIWSYGSGYGGNALLGKKCLALRMASLMGQKQGWLAEHMLILGLENANKQKKYIAAAFPSACGKTNLAMLVPPSEYSSWKVTTVGDDIAWIRPDKNGVPHAINPESGFFGVAPGTSEKTNPNAMQTISKNTIFTNVALTPDGDVWWEGMTSEVPEKLIDWKGNSWNSEMHGRVPAAHPNARFTAPASQCPSMDELWENPEGVPLSAFVFGGRRATTMPLVTECTSWAQGVYLASMMGSETTAAMIGATGEVRRDPMAMLPFCGYNISKYLSHWLEMGNIFSNEIKIFQVNWFRKNKEGNFIWPGYGENMRVLEWIFSRTQNKLAEKNLVSENESSSALGVHPCEKGFNFKGLSHFELNSFKSCMEIKTEEWKVEMESQRQFIEKISASLPQEIASEFEKLKKVFL
jgi:phosphoenolpyruvate carboxykinase (GTP)